MKMSDADLISTVERKVTQSNKFHSGALQRDREKALKYYRGEAFGILARQEGRSGVISRDVAEVIDSLMPNIMRVFTSGDRAVEYEPVGQEDEQFAEQATDYANYIWHKENPGFQITHTWVKDGLLQRNGIVKIWWDESKRTTKETLSGLNKDELEALAGDPEVEIVEIEEIPA